MALTRIPAPVAMIPAGEPMGGSSFMVAMIIPHTRRPTPVPIPTTARPRQTRGFLEPQINRTTKTMATMPTMARQPPSDPPSARIGPTNDLLMVALQSLTARLATGLAILAWCALFVATHLPVIPNDMVGVRGSDKLFHFAGFAVLSLLCCWAISSHRRVTLVLYVCITAVLVCYAGIDELLQIPIPSRCADPFDWLADVAGVACGVFVFALIVAVKSLLAPHQGTPQSPPR